MDSKKDKNLKYVQSKIAHMKRSGVNASLSEAGAAQPDHAKSEAEERRIRQERILKRRKENELNQDIEWHKQ